MRRIRKRNKVNLFCARWCLRLLCTPLASRAQGAHALCSSINFHASGCSMVLTFRVTPMLHYDCRGLVWDTSRPQAAPSDGQLYISKPKCNGLGHPPLDKFQVNCLVEYTQIIPFNTSSTLLTYVAIVQERLAALGREEAATSFEHHEL